MTTLSARALTILREWVQSESLRKHCYAVADSMKHFAQLRSEDVDLWEAVGLLHDMDYERHPNLEHSPTEGHPFVTLYAVDELSGFVIAVGLVRPTKSIHDVDLTSVKKKMKDKAFARAVNRDDIVRGAEGLGMPLDNVIVEVITALKADAKRLGLAGNVPAG